LLNKIVSIIKKYNVYFLNIYIWYKYSI
jgi:hypothetical protein